MKKAILILGAALGLALAGCNQPEGSSSDTYSTSTGSGTNAPSSRNSINSSVNTNRASSAISTNQTPKSTP